MNNFKLSSILRKIEALTINRTKDKYRKTFVVVLIHF